MGSDIGHFDVVNMADVLKQAYEPVDEGRITRDDGVARDLPRKNSRRFRTSGEEERPNWRLRSGGKPVDVFGPLVPFDYQSNAPRKPFEDAKVLGMCSSIVP
jgi:hypothetical protein